MKLNRVLVTLSVMLATTLTVAAQQPSTTPPVQSTLPYYPPPPPAAYPPGAYQLLEQETQTDCPLMGTSTWYVRTMEHALAAWQRLRAVGAIAKQTPGCCEAGCCAGGSAKPASGIKVICCVKGCEVTQGTKACCCAKACACCESCKESKTTKATCCQPMCLPFPMFEAVARPHACQPATGAAIPMMPQVGGMQWNANGMPMEIRQIVINVPVQTQTRSARLTTPDFEAHCERMTQRGDSVVLEGNVLLLCKKHAQPVRIEGQRVVVNLRDSSFTVESNVGTTTSSFGVLRSTDFTAPMPSTQGSHRFMRPTPTTPSSTESAPSTWTMPVLPSGTYPYSLPYPLENVRPVERR